jgi:hypothetical protein
MDVSKDALKKKLQQVLSIEISIKNPGKEKEEQDKSDLAPTVKDSDEPGVIKSDQKSIEENEEAGEDLGEPFRNALIAQSPDHPAMGKTLESIAKERALKRVAKRKNQDE